jgi:hypothetical protein
MISSPRARRGRELALSAWVLAVAAVAPAAAQAPAPAGGGVVTVEHFLGSWELVEWVATNQQGQTSHPYGENAQGQITYTGDGRMSAHLMRPPEDPADAPPQHLAYWGTFSLQAAERTVTHHVIGADARNWLGTDQVRQFRFDGPDRLILSVGGQFLTWRRAGETR